MGHHEGSPPDGLRAVLDLTTTPAHHAKPHQGCIPYRGTALLRMSSPLSMKEPAMSSLVPMLRATALGVASILVIVLVPIPLLAAIWVLTGFNIFTFR